MTLALPAWGYPPPTAEGQPTPADTPQARLDWALAEMISYLRETAKRERRKALEIANQAAIQAALAGLDSD